MGLAGLTIACAVVLMLQAHFFPRSLKLQFVMYCSSIIHNNANKYLEIPSLQVWMEDQRLAILPSESLSPTCTCT